MSTHYFINRGWAFVSEADLGSAVSEVLVKPVVCKVVLDEATSQLLWYFLWQIDSKDVF